MNNDLRLSHQQLQQPLLLVSTSQGDNVTDCACPDRPFAVAFSEHGAASSSHVQVSGAFMTALNENFHLVLSPFAPGGPTAINNVAWQRWHEFSLPRTLNDRFDKQLAEQRLIYPVDQPPIPVKQDVDTFTIWIHITNACNLDCPYCYVRKSSQTLDIASGQAALDSIFSSALVGGFSRVKLKYAGGEATLHFRLIRALHAHAVSLAKTTALELKEVILTNGTMLQPGDAAWCKDEGIKLMISLDGVGEVHDLLRPGRHGSSSFKQIERTVDGILLPLKLLPDITMTVTGTNAPGAADVVKWAMVERHLPLSFNLYRANALSVQHKELAWEEQTLIDGLLAAYSVIESHLPDEPFLNGLIDRGQTHAHTNTCGVGQSYVVVTHTGRIAQCQMHLDQSVAFEQTDNIIPLVAQGLIQNLPVDEKEGCRECEFRYRCTGGCPVETFRATGRWDIKSPNCAIYKTLWPAALRLEGLRLLKVNGYLS